MEKSSQRVLRPNQSLKLTETAVDDFAARHCAENDMINRYVRAMNCMELAVRRRSLAPVRYASLAAGEVLRNKIE